VGWYIFKIVNCGGVVCAVQQSGFAGVVDTHLRETDNHCSNWPSSQRQMAKLSIHKFGWNSKENASFASGHILGGGIEEQILSGLLLANPPSP
jgi:hypothetical protein